MLIGASVIVLLTGLSAASTPAGFVSRVQEDLSIVYNNKVPVYPPGIKLTKNITTNPPTLFFKNASSPDHKYAAIMIDYVLNLNGTEMNILQWYQPDLTLNPSGTLTTSSLLSTMNAAPYISPQPLPGPAHEYITLLYQQPSNYKFPTCLDSVVQSTKGRFGFNLEDFVKDAGLDEPVAANWFRMQNPTPASTSYAITSTSITTYFCSATVTATS